MCCLTSIERAEKLDHANEWHGPDWGLCGLVSCPPHDEEEEDRNCGGWEWGDGEQQGVHRVGGMVRPASTLVAAQADQGETNILMKTTKGGRSAATMGAGGGNGGGLAGTKTTPPGALIHVPGEDTAVLSPGGVQQPTQQFTSLLKLVPLVLLHLHLLHSQTIVCSKTLTSLRILRPVETTCDCR